jgi:hypothetical protein
MSYFEQILGCVHPLQLLMPKSGEALKEAVLELSSLDKPTETEKNIRLKYNTGNFVSPTDENEKELKSCSVYAENDMPVKFKLEVRGSPLYEDYTSDPTTINPPVGFQSVHLTYCWPSKVGELEFQWPTNQLYAIRPISPDDPPPPET